MPAAAAGRTAAAAVVVVWAGGHTRLHAGGGWMAAPGHDARVVPERQDERAHELGGKQQQSLLGLPRGSAVGAPAARHRARRCRDLGHRRRSCRGRRTLARARPFHGAASDATQRSAPRRPRRGPEQPRRRLLRKQRGGQ